MRYTEIDGVRYGIKDCYLCPFFNVEVWSVPECKYPSNDEITLLSLETVYSGIDTKCPLREIE